VRALAKNKSTRSCCFDPIRRRIQTTPGSVQMAATMRVCDVQVGTDRDNGIANPSQGRVIRFSMWSSILGLHLHREALPVTLALMD
jgi:hypothetical protein